MGFWHECWMRLGEDQVQMPLAATSATIVRGVEAVSAVLEENRRQEEIRQREAEARMRAEVGEPDPLARYKTCSETAYPDVPTYSHKRRPPDLNARTLSFSARLVKYVRERCDGKAPMAYKRAGIDRKLYSRIVSDDCSSVSKLTALQLAIGLQLSRQEADEFLNAAGYALSPTIPLDCAFAYCIDQGVWNILDVNRILVGAGLKEMNLVI